MSVPPLFPCVGRPPAGGLGGALPGGFPQRFYGPKFYFFALKIFYLVWGRRIGVFFFFCFFSFFQGEGGGGAEKYFPIVPGVFCLHLVLHFWSFSCCNISQSFAGGEIRRVKKHFAPAKALPALWRPDLRPEKLFHVDFKFVVSSCRIEYYNIYCAGCARLVCRCVRDACGRGLRGRIFAGESSCKSVKQLIKN